MAIAIFCKNNASNAPMKPNTIAMLNCNTGVGSCIKCGANSTPAANPTAATQSQKSFLPKNKITAPIRTLRIGIGRFMIR